MAVSRTMWLRGIQIDAGKMKMNARDERDKRTKEIAVIWRDGFKRLKEENDNYQMRRDDDYKKEIAEIDAMTKSQIAQGPPKD